MDETPTIQQDATTTEVKQGIRAFGIRQVAGQFLGFFYSILIARTLGPYEFGIFAICCSVLAVLSFAGNAGQAAPIMRDPNTPSESLLRTLFTTYFCLSLAAAATIWVAAPLLPRLYPELQSNHIWLVRLMAAGVVINSLAGVPYALLERELRFREVAAVEFLQTVVFSLSALLLAWRGLGVWALGIAALLRTLSGTVGLWILHPWRLRPGIDLVEFQSAIPVSLAFQTSAISNALREQFYPLLVGTLCGPLALGYLTWAKSSASKPMEVVSMFDRVAFPWYAKVNRDSGDLRGAVSASIMLLASALFPLTGLMLALAEPAIRYIYGPKWLPALPAFWILCLALLAVPLRGPLQNALESLANAKVLYRCALVGFVAQWGVGVLGTLAWGYVGAALALPAQVLAVAVYCHLKSRKTLRLALLSLLLRPAVHALAGSLVASAIVHRFARSPEGFLVAGLLSVTAFLALAPLLQPDASRKWLVFVRDTLPVRYRRLAQPVSSN